MTEHAPPRQESLWRAGPSGATIRLLIGLCLAFWATAGVIVLSMSARNATDERWIMQAHETRRLATTVALNLTRAETAAFGYRLSRAPSFAREGLESRNRARVALQALRAEAAENHGAERASAVFEAAATARLSRLDADLAPTQASPEADDALAAALERLDGAERDLLVSRADEARRNRSVQTVGILSAMVAAIALAGIVRLYTVRAARDLREAYRTLSRETLQRESAEEQLRQAQKMEALGQLTGGIAHDFNNMLAIIIGNLDMLARRVARLDEALSPMVENALAGAERAASLTRRLLAFSRRQPLAPTAVAIDHCVRDMAEMLARSIGETLTIKVQLPEDLWRGFVDRPQLESALLNLAVNARDAMPGGGALTISADNVRLDAATAVGWPGLTEQPAEGGYVAISVRDTGTGMSPEVLARAIEPFFTTKSPGAGTGLGLSQVYGFARQTGGHMTIDSAPGHGTTVTLFIPRADPTAAAAGTPPPPPTQAPAVSHTIFVVEDETGVRDFVVAALRELGYAVRAAAGSREALRLLAEASADDILLTDIAMPGGDGVALAREARRRLPGLKVIYMSGHAADAMALDDASALIAKPFTVQQLQAALRRAFAEGETLDRPPP